MLFTGYNQLPINGRFMNTYGEILERFNAKIVQIRRNDGAVDSLARCLVNRTEARLEAPAGTISWGTLENDGTFDRSHWMANRSGYSFTLQCAFPTDGGDQLVNSMLHVQTNEGNLRVNVEGVSPVSIPLPVNIEDPHLTALVEHVLQDIRLQILDITS